MDKLSCNQVKDSVFPQKRIGIPLVMFCASGIAYSLLAVIYLPKDQIFLTPLIGSSAFIIWTLYGVYKVAFGKCNWFDRTS